MPRPRRKRIQPPTWDNQVAIDWQWVPPPSRPSLSELLVFQDALVESGKPRDSRAMILGSTAELRDMAFEFGFETTIVDYNLRNFELLMRHCRHPAAETQDELYASVARVTTILNEDWREMEFDDDELFDVVLGDLAVNMVPLKEQRSLLARIVQCIRPGGTSIQRIWVRDPERYSPRVTTVQDILAKHDRAKTESQRNHFYWLALPLISYFHDEESNETRFQDILAEFEILYKKGEINQELYDSFLAPWRHYVLPNVLPTKTEANLMFDELNIDYEVRYGSDWFSDMSPIYILRH